jgi:putative intracellular protease/amidase
MSTSLKHLRVGAVLFTGFELLDVFGPLEMFGLLKDRCTITTFALRAGNVRSSQGPAAHADMALADARALDILLVPGGWGTRAEVDNTKLLDLIRAKSAHVKIVASVCTGSALLARAGLLYGREATTNKLAWDWVVSQGPGVHWVRKARWVEDGKVFTSSGVSAGMDMTLAIIAKTLGKAAAKDVTTRAEYLWNSDSGNDPFA